jgi:hypothetical protein
MATRGYFKIVNGEDLEDVYQKKGDIFVEAFHDGYLDDMLMDILSIPFKIVEMQRHGYGKQFVSFNFFPNGRRFEGSRKYFTTFKKLLDENRALGFYDMMWSDVLPYLQFTCFSQYQDIDEGVTRYGHPVTLDDAEFVVKTEYDENDDRIDWTEISDIKVAEYYGDETEVIEEFWKKQTAIIEEFNRSITQDKFKIQLKDGVIRFSITGIILSLIYDELKKGV